MTQNHLEHSIETLDSVKTKDSKEVTVQNISIDELINSTFDSNSPIKCLPLEVRLRYEEDVAEAYRAYYKDKVVYDKRNELGRFLFGVSFTTIGFLITLYKLSSPSNSISTLDLILSISSGVFLVLSGICSLLLAIPKNQDIDPTQVELIELHRSHSNELSLLSKTWFLLWLIGFILGIVIIFI